MRVPVYKGHTRNQSGICPAECKRSRSSLPYADKVISCCVRGTAHDLASREVSCAYPYTWVSPESSGSRVRPSVNGVGHQDLRGGGKTPLCQGSRVRPSNNEAGHRDLAQKGSNPSVLGHHPSDPAARRSPRYMIHGFSVLSWT